MATAIVFDLDNTLYDEKSAKVAGERAVADALIALPLLRKRASLWIATNEHAAVQARKLEALGLTDHVDGVVAAGKLDSASIDGCEPTYEIEHLTELVGIIDVSG